MTCVPAGGMNLKRSGAIVSLTFGLSKSKRLRLPWPSTMRTRRTCEVGVSIVLEPDHVVYGNVTLEDVDAIADGVKNGVVVDRLVIAPPAAPAAPAKGA